MKSVPSFSLRIWRSLCKALSSSTLPKENPRGSESRSRSSSLPRSLPVKPRATVPAQPGCHVGPQGHTQRAVTACAASILLLVSREDHHTPFLHASLNIKTARPKEKAALVSGGCESSGFCLMHLFQDSRNSRQTCRALRLSHLSLEMSPPFWCTDSKQAARETKRLTPALPGAPLPCSLPPGSWGCFGPTTKIRHPKLCHLLQDFDVPIVQAVIH